MIHLVRYPALSVLRKMAYTLPLPAYICQKGIQSVFPGSTSRLLPGIESTFPSIQSINSSPSSVLLTPVETGQSYRLQSTHKTQVDCQPGIDNGLRSQTSMPSSSLPLPAAEYFGESLVSTFSHQLVLTACVGTVHVAWNVINGNTELSSQPALHFTTHPPTPPPQAPILHPEPAFRDYILRLITTTAVSQSVVLIALLYLYKARSVLQRQLVIGDVVDKRQGFSMCAASLMLGNKFLDDNTYTSRTWATLSGYSLWEINDCEKRLLHALDFQLNISLQDYNDWWRFLVLFTPSSVKTSQGMQTDLAGPSRPLTAESRAPLMSVSQRRISRVETSRPSSRKRSYDDAKVVNVNKRVMLSTYQRPLASMQAVTCQNHPSMFIHEPHFSVPPPQLYPFAVDNSHDPQVSEIMTAAFTYG